MSASSEAGNGPSLSAVTSMPPMFRVAVIDTAPAQRRSLAITTSALSAPGSRLSLRLRRSLRPGHEARVPGERSETRDPGRHVKALHNDKCVGPYRDWYNVSVPEIDHEIPHTTTGHRARHRASARAVRDATSPRAGFPHATDHAGRAARRRRGHGRDLARARAEAVGAAR